MKFKVDTQHITLTDPALTFIVAGTSGRYVAEFEFTEEWEGYLKTAVFRTVEGELSYVILTEDTCGIPSAIVTEGCHFVVGVYGVSGSLHYPTVWTNTLRVEEGCAEAIDTIEPTPGMMDQLLAITSAAQQSAANSADSAAAAVATAQAIEDAAEAGEFTPTISIGATNTGAPGTNASVLNAGTNTEVSLIFTIPRGFAGPQGPAGAEGESAYQSAQQAGYQGTKADFNESMAAAAQVAPLTADDIDELWEEN